MSRSTVIRAIKLLEEEGIVVKQARKRLDGDWNRSNKYWLLVPQEFMDKYGVKNG